MKKMVAWTLLVIYLNAAAQALLPWVSDMMSHAFNWHDHLEHVHHGQVHSHHVGHEMADLEKDSTDHPFTPHSFSYSKDVLSAHLLRTTTIGYNTSRHSWVALSTIWTFYYKNVTGDVLLPPPDAPPSFALA